MVLSIICNMSNAPPLSASACSKRSQTPDSHQRRNCFHTEFHLPNAAGKSRHGAPVRQIQSMPSNLCRWFLGGRPPREEGMVSKGAKIAHSSSVISPRIIVGLGFAKRPIKIHRKSLN
jgi:hypothetical protein